MEQLTKLSVKDLLDALVSNCTHDDVAVSKLFGTVCEDRFLYVREVGSYYYYDGRRWAPDTGNLRIREFAKTFATRCVQWASSQPDETRRQSDVRFFQRYLSEGCRTRLIRDTESVIPASMSDFDKQPFLLNCMNGTLSLVPPVKKEYVPFLDGDESEDDDTGGILAPHNPKDMLTKLANVTFDPDADGTEIRHFVSTVMMNDTEQIDYLQRSLGYSITGDSSQECFFILSGASTRNGKSTLLGAVSNMMGDYGRTASWQTLASTKYKNSSGPSEDLARLAGARFVQVSEPEEGFTLNASLIKQLTGNDLVCARYLHQNSFEFQPSFKIWLNANSKPRITDVTVFDSDRVKLITFDKHFTEQERDTGLKARLAKPENLSALLNWCLKGAHRVLIDGKLVTPERVLGNVMEYRKENDTLAEFTAACLIKDVDNKRRIKATEVYKRYRQWCLDNGYVGIWNSKSLRNRMQERGYKFVSYGGQACLVGYNMSDSIPDSWLSPDAG